MADDFVEKHDAFVRGIAQRIRVELDLSTDVDDLVSDGFQGLLEARTRFDESRGIHFTTFAYYRVRGAILDGVRRMGFASRRAQEKFRRVAALELALEAEGEARAREGEAADLSTGAAVLDDLVGKMYASVIAAAAAAEDRALAESPEDAVVSRFERARVRKALAALPERELIVIRAMYFEDRVLDDVGAQLRLSRSRVSRIHTRALGMLRAALG